MENSHDFYDQILSNAPSPKTLLLVLSRLKEEGQLERVIQECTKALDTYPNDIYIRRLLAQTYLETNHIPDAEAELKKVTELLSDLADVYKLQADMYRDQEKHEEADEALGIYVAHHPHEKENLLPAHDSASDRASAPFSEDEDTELPEIVTPTLAELYFDQGQMDEAISSYESLVTLNPENEDYKNRLAELKTMTEESSADQDVLDSHMAMKKRMVGILESWRSNIRETISPA